ncbi:hypothetical protein [Mycobacterium sp.]|uniref:hypothetical protein n=1 Tax=Mycobacterium sp. TaxID=1785 RepID=UPI003D10432B
MSPAPRVIAKFSHAARINTLAYSPDGRRLATASDDHTVQIRAVADGSLVSTLTANQPLQHVSFAPNGSLVAATGYRPQTHVSELPSGSVFTFDPATGTQSWKVEGHFDTRCTFSADGTRAVLSNSAAVESRDPHTGTQQWVFAVPANQTFTDASLSGDAATVAVATRGNTQAAGNQILLLEAASGAVRRNVERSAPVRAVSFSGDRGLLAFGTDDEIGIVDLATNAVRVLPNPTVPQHGNLREVLSIRFSPDDTLIGVVSVTINGINPTIDVLRADTFALLNELPNGFSGVFGFSPDSRWALSAENTTDARVWDVATGVEQFTLLQDTADGIGAAVFGPTGATAAVAAGNTATVLQLPVRERFRLLHDGPVRAVAFSPDGSQVLTGSRDSTARVFDAAAGSQLVTFAHDGPVNSAVWIPGQPSVATASADHFARIFDVGTPAVARVRVPHDGAVNVVCVDADGQSLASGGDDGIVHLTEVASGNLLHSFSHAGPVRAAVFSPDGTRLASGGDDGIVLLTEVASGNLLRSFSHGPNNAVRAVAFSADGTRLATGCEGGSARVFGTDSDTPVWRVDGLGPVRAVAFSPDGAQLALGSADSTALIVASDSGHELHRLLGHNGAVEALAYRAGTLLVTGSADHTARVFDTSTGAPLASYGHDGAVHAVSVDHAGLMLATASEDKTARLYALPE